MFNREIDRIYFKTNIMRELIIGLVFLFGIFTFLVVNITERGKMVERLRIDNIALKNSLENTNAFNYRLKKERVNMIRNSGRDKFKNDVYGIMIGDFNDILDAIYDESKRASVDPFLVMGVIKTESNFDPTAISKTSEGENIAYGLMQINYAVWGGPLNLNKDMILDVRYNIRHGIKVLKHYLKMANGNVNKALYLYNNGPSGMYNNLKYSPKVLKVVNTFRSR